MRRPVQHGEAYYPAWSPKRTTQIHCFYHIISRKHHCCLLDFHLVLGWCVSVTTRGSLDIPLLYRSRRDVYKRRDHDAQHQRAKRREVMYQAKARRAQQLGLAVSDLKDSDFPQDLTQDDADYWRDLYEQTW